MAGNSTNQSITLKNQLNPNLTKLNCPNFSFWYDKSRLVNNWERLSYFDYNTATYPDTILDTENLAKFNILNDRSPNAPIGNTDNSKCKFVINPKNSTYYGNTGGDASRSYIQIEQFDGSIDEYIANNIGIAEECGQWNTEDLINQYNLKGRIEAKYCKFIGGAGFGIQNSILRIITFQSKGIAYRIKSPKAETQAEKYKQYIQDNDLKDIFQYLKA